MMAAKTEAKGTNNNNHSSNSSSKSSLLPSFSELLWCSDVENEGLSQGIGGAMLSSSPMTEDSLEDLTDLVGPELASLVGNVTPLKPVTTSVTSTSSSASNGNNSNNNNNSNDGNSLSDMPADISDLRSSDLLQTLPGMIDIDKIFADFQAEHHHQQNPTSSASLMHNNNNNNNNLIPNQNATFGKSRKVIIHRKNSFSDLVSAVAHRTTNLDYDNENNNNNNNNTINNNNNNVKKCASDIRRYMSPPPKFPQGQNQGKSM